QQRLSLLRPAATPGRRSPRGLEVRNRRRQVVFVGGPRRQGPLGGRRRQLPLGQATRTTAEGSLIPNRIARRSPPAGESGAEPEVHTWTPARESVANHVLLVGEPRVAGTNGVLSDAKGEAGDASLGPRRLVGTPRRGDG